MSSPLILISGATGKTGRRVMERLQARDINTRGVSRQSSPAMDWENPQTWPAVLDGVDTAYITYAPDLAMPEAPGILERFASAARRAGVRHLVLLSGRGERNTLRCEAAIAQSGMMYTILRCSWFHQNFCEGKLHDAVLQGTLAIPAGDVLEPMVDLEDVADVAVEALLDPARHQGQIYELTGPALLTFHQAAAMISEASRREVRYLPISLETFHEAITAQAGREMGDMLTRLCREAFDGRNAFVGDGVQRALGRAPRTFEAYCHRIASSGVWDIEKGPDRSDTA